jgi:hypothetical protein
VQSIVKESMEAAFKKIIPEVVFAVAIKWLRLGDKIQ